MCYLVECFLVQENPPKEYSLLDFTPALFYSLPPRESVKTHSSWKENAHCVFSLSCWFYQSILGRPEGWLENRTGALLPQRYQFFLKSFPSILSSVKNSLFLINNFAWLHYNYDKSVSKIVLLAKWNILLRFHGDLWVKMDRVHRGKWLGKKRHFFALHEKSISPLGLSMKSDIGWLWGLKIWKIKWLHHLRKNFSPEFSPNSTSLFTNRAWRSSQEKSIIVLGSFWGSFFSWYVHSPGLLYGLGRPKRKFGLTEWMVLKDLISTFELGGKRSFSSFFF